MQSKVVLLLLVVGCSMAAAFIAPEGRENSLVPTESQQLDLFGNSRRLIEQLIETLRKAGQDANDAIARVGARIQETATSVRDRVVGSIQQLRESVDSAIEALENRLIDSGVSIVDCIATHNGDANVLFNDTVTKTLSCVDDRIAEVGEEITAVRTMTTDAMDYSNRVLEDMEKCSDEGANFFTTGTCLGGIAMQTQWRAMIYSAQSAFAISRINLSMATLPAALEVCAGSRLVEAGMRTARILMDIGTCSATSVYNTMTGNVETSTKIFQF